MQDDGREELDTVGDMAGFNHLLTPMERLCALVIAASLWLTANAPGTAKELLRGLLGRPNRQYVAYTQEMQSGAFADILQVFEAVSEQTRTERKRVAGSPSA